MLFTPRSNESYFLTIGFTPRSVGQIHGIIELYLCVWLGYRHYPPVCGCSYLIRIFNRCDKIERLFICRNSSHTCLIYFLLKTKYGASFDIEANFYEIHPKSG
ncbi:MAG: hypothetical protein GW856_10505 [Cyanobacteria bacterium]|nr:hypothetical protein [Cyanobacteria bacterium CG_2015-16_32_12]NCO78394.1 hypothetical protein [Cyanobacteria bacterium CG_2015-22_32_23]NCQ02963.1 hypothetical protein [Cyanobacteria bacterium CG_2015-09_32_10]NCS85037.1 hypothetical protein [Cyanobacteria bacterium CG_2015-02_32_10]